MVAGDVAGVAQRAQPCRGERFVPAGAPAAFVEQRGGLVVGVLVEQLVGEFHGVIGGGVQLPGGQRAGQRHGVVLPAGEADGDGDVLAGLDEGDVGDQQPNQALAFAHGSGWIVPQGREIGGQCAYAAAVRVVEGTLGAGLGGVVVVFGGSEFAQRGVVVGFEVVGDESVGGVDSEVASPGQVGGVLGALDVGGADAVGVFGLRGDLVGDGERYFHRQGGEAVQDQFGDSGVYACAADVLADRGAGGDSSWVEVSSTDKMSAIHLRLDQVLDDGEHDFGPLW